VDPPRRVVLFLGIRRERNRIRGRRDVELPPPSSAPLAWVSGVWAQLVGSIPFLALAHAPGLAYLAATSAATSVARIGQIPLTVPTARPESPRSRVLIGPNPPVVSHYKPGYSATPSSASVLVSASTPTRYVRSPSPSWRQPPPRPTPASRTPTRFVPSPTARPPRSNPPATRSSAAVPHRTVDTRVDQRRGPHVSSWSFIGPRGWCTRA
jgi:hypothetical protein